MLASLLYMTNQWHRRGYTVGLKNNIFVDELLIYSEGGDLPTQERLIKPAINGISQWLTQHGYELSS